MGIGVRSLRVFLVGAAVACVALVVALPASATNIRYYVASATSSPTPLTAGKAGTVTVRLTNCKGALTSGCGTTTSNAGLGSAWLTFPAGFTVGTVASISKTGWTSTVVGNVVKLKGTTSTRIPAGSALTVTVNVTAPATPGTPTIVTKAAYGVTDTASDLAFVRKGADPTVTVVAPALDRLEFVPQPGNATAGVPFSVTVKGKDADLLPVSGKTVSLALGNNPGGNAALSASGTLDANGSVTFPNVALTKAGTGYTLVASSGAVTRTSEPFNVTHAALRTLGVGAQVDRVAGETFGVTVTGVDEYGNNVSGTGVSLDLLSPADGGPLSGTSTGTLVDGTVTIGGLSIQKAAAGYAFRASAPGDPSVATVDSNTFAVAAAALSKIEFVQQPTETKVATVMAPVTVKATDAYGNLNAGSVSLVLGANPGGGTLGGTVANVALDVSGLASFTNLTVDKAGLGYTLVASIDGPGSGSATSSSFDIVNETCETNGVDCVATTDPTGQGATPTNNTVGSINVIDNGTGSGTGSLFIALDDPGACPLAGGPIGKSVVFVPQGFAGAFAKATVRYDSSITPNPSWTYKFCIDKPETAPAPDYPNVPLCLVAVLGYSNSPLLDALSWIFNYGSWTSALNAYVSANGPCILRRGRVSGGDLEVQFYLKANDPKITGWG